MLNQSIYVYDNTLFYLNKLLFHVKQYNKGAVTKCTFLHLRYSPFYMQKLPRLLR